QGTRSRAGKEDRHLGIAKREADPDRVSDSPTDAHADAEPRQGDVALTAAVGAHRAATDAEERAAASRDQCRRRHHPCALGSGSQKVGVVVAINSIGVTVTSPPATWRVFSV